MGCYSRALLGGGGMRPAAAIRRSLDRKLKVAHALGVSCTSTAMPFLFMNFKTFGSIRSTRPPVPKTSTSIRGSSM
uniref:Uncharacterized protein n=1 Tax=Anguilla anguilla TaxID=7936 RepID=A0A0E9WYY5_ANGAN